MASWASFALVRSDFMRDSSMLLGTLSRVGMNGVEAGVEKPHRR